MTRVRQFSSLSRRFCESKLQMRNSKPYISVKPMILSTSQQNNRIKEEIIRTTVSKISDFKPNLANYYQLRANHQYIKVMKLHYFYFLRVCRIFQRNNANMRISQCVIPKNKTINQKKKLRNCTKLYNCLYSCH